MARVTFVNEHRVIEADAGASVAAIAKSAGIAIGRVCWVDGAVSERTWSEKLRGMRGWRRAPGSVRVLGDAKVYSAPVAADRVAVARDIAPPPSPVTDASAPRKGVDAASTAAHVHGHPSMIGRGSQAPPAVPDAPESHANAARPLTTVPPPPEKE
jgi:hypothetical protein